MKPQSVQANAPRGGRFDASYKVLKTRQASREQQIFTGARPADAVLSSSRRSQKPLAVVQVISYPHLDPNDAKGVHVFVKASILSLRGRLHAIYGDSVPFDQVAMFCNHGSKSRAAREMPTVRFVWFNCSEIMTPALLHNEVWPGVFGKIGAMLLTEYDKVLVVDLDTTILTDIYKLMQRQAAPAMVQWGDFPKLEYNSGVWLVNPSKVMYYDAIEALSLLGPNLDARTKGLQMLAATEGTTMSMANPSVVAYREDILRKNPSLLYREVARLSTFITDQDFLFAFFTTMYGEKHGPLYSLPPRYNVRHGSLLQLQQLDLSNGTNWYQLFLVAFGGYSARDVGMERGPAIVHSTLEKVYNTNLQQCDRVHQLYWNASMWAWSEICRAPCPTTDRTCVLEGVAPTWCSSNETAELAELAVRVCHLQWPL